MSTIIPFLTFESMEVDAEYVAISFQYLNCSTGHFFIIKMFKHVNSQGGPVYYMNVQRGHELYDVLDNLRVSTPQRRFGISKKRVAIANGLSELFLIVSSVNDVVDLN